MELRLKSLISRLGVSLAVLLIVAPVGWAQDANEEMYRVANRINKRIRMLSNYGVFDNISFGMQSTPDGSFDVVLRGQASRPTLKKSAERDIQRIEEVNSVTNEIEVLPTSSGDERIRLATYAAIYGHPTLSIYNPNRGAPPMGTRQTLTMGISTNPPQGPHPVHIIVNQGRVTLEGMLDREGDKRIAVAQAQSVNGVFEVTDNIQVRQSKR